MQSIGLFAGIGGIEKGLEASGIETIGLCEIDAAARLVLKQQFRAVDYWDDVTAVRKLPPHDVLSAGFPCQDLSQAGRKAGIEGTQSGLVNHIFRLLDKSPEPQWVLLENVSYMLKLGQGRAMSHIADELETRGYRWAYRTIDARSFGIPQRRQRVVLVASRANDPRDVLFADDHDFNDFGDQIGKVDLDALYGFYWTEGLRGLGWARDSVPTIKGGSRIGIPSPPAIWSPRRDWFGTPVVEDAERMQGFCPGYTAIAGEKPFRSGTRWHLVGNAVCVPMAKWVGTRLADPGLSDSANRTRRIKDGKSWPGAAWGEAGGRFEADIGLTPIRPTYNLETFLSRPTKPLSLRASSGFLSRARRSPLRFPDGFLDSLARYVAKQSVES